MKSDILELVKKTLRVSSSYTDDEILIYINACKNDLIETGVSMTKANDFTDDLIKTCIVLYCRANFGLGEDGSKEYAIKQYEKLRNKLSYCSNYNTEETEV